MKLQLLKAQGIAIAGKSDLWLQLLYFKYICMVFKNHRLTGSKVIRRETE